MSDARALLRQQREARRITHPQASYSSSGALICLTCRVPVKTESRWDAHLQSEQHKLHAQQLIVQASRPQQKDGAQRQATETELVQTEDAYEHPSGKRRLGGNAYDDDDDDDDAGDESEGPRLKRSKASFQGRLTPPNLTRLSSTTPSQGVEIQIPSRPATPRAALSSGSIGSQGIPLQTKPLASGLPPQKTAEGKAEKEGINEDEWANFEADISSLSYDASATISAPVLTASEAAAAAATTTTSMTDPEQEKELARAKLEDEKEEAARALEDEFDEMQNLEAKVLKFKERRESIRQRAVSSVQMGDTNESVTQAGNQNVGAVIMKENGNDNNDDDDDDYDDDDNDDDDWDGFRFRVGVKQ